MRETFERNDFHRAAAQSAACSGVMNDVAIADVDAMTAVERADRDEMRGKGGFFANTGKGIPRE